MNSVFQGPDKRWRYALLTEGGQSLCKLLVSDRVTEEEFIAFLPDKPDSFSITQLEGFWKQFLNERKRTRQ